MTKWQFLGLLIIITLGFFIIQNIIIFYFTHTIWFWVIVAIIVAIPIYYFLRIKIRNALHYIFNRNKQKPTEIQNKKADK